jgi:flagellin
LVNGDPLQGVEMKTEDYGSNATVRVEVVIGNPADFATENAIGNPAWVDDGLDIELNINGGHVVGQGLTAHFANASIDMDLVFAEAWNTAGPPANTTFEITSGGALFQLGPQISTDQQDSIGIMALDSTSLGQSGIGYLSQMRSGGSLSLISGDAAQMAAVVKFATNQVAAIRSRVGSFQNNTLSMAINSLKQAQENISGARSVIMDADYAQETAIVTRQEILVSATQSAMIMAHSVPRAILQLLAD